MVSTNKYQLISIFLQCQQIIKYAFAIGSTINIIPYENDLVVFGDPDLLFQQSLEGFAASMNIPYGNSSFQELLIYEKVRIKLVNCTRFLTPVLR